MPNYSRSHLGRFIRKMFAQEIERELRMLEEFVMTDEPSDDVGESLMVRDEDFEPPEVPFQPKPTSVSVAALPNDFSTDSNFTTMPKADGHDRHVETDIHQQQTVILDGRGRHAPKPPPTRGRTQPPPPPRKSSVKPIYDEDLHAAPTMIIDINRVRRRRGSSARSNVNLPPTFVNSQWSYIYSIATQNLTIPIVVKKEADFELVGSNGTMAAGQKKGELKATYKNIGDEPVSDAIARLSIFKPFSSIDDQAYIGSLDPQEAKTVIFRLDVDSDATPKDYVINSEIKYTDVNGDTIISESMKIPVTVTASSRSMLLPILIVLIILALAGGYWYKRKQK